jgi:hypothetical protein
MMKERNPYFFLLLFIDRTKKNRYEDKNKVMGIILDKKRQIGGTMHPVIQLSFI